jgi:FMN-dependent NADH-azoreductase
LIITSGGTRVGSKDDYLTPWLKHVLNFFGITNIQIISADQMSIDHEGSVKKAEEQINKIS